MSKTKKIGRPNSDENKRGKLISAARHLFVIHDYDKVSIRAIAKLADVDSALIRYYFQSKLGLFTAMVQETAEPVIAQFNKQSNALNADSASQLMTTYYSVMSQNPDFPKLIFKIASMQETAHNKALKKILSDIINPKNFQIFPLMQKQGLLKEQVDPQCMQISFFSMMVFPFLIPDFFKQLLQLETTPDFMAHLALHNSQLLQHGCIKTETTETKEIS